MSAPVLRAVCEGCEAEADVSSDALLAFDCVCPVCGGVLVLEEEEEAAQAAPDAPAPGGGPIADVDLADLEAAGFDVVQGYGLDPAPETAAHARPSYEDRPTLQDRHPGVREPRSPHEDRPTKDDDSGLRQPLPPMFADRPTKADTDPYELAAAALDSSVAAPRPTGLFAAPADPEVRAVTSRRTTQAVATWSETDLDDEPPSGSVVLLPGRPATSPPLPAWDEDDLSTEDLEVVEVSGTAGRGSRTFERESMPAARVKTPAPLPPAEVAPPPAEDEPGEVGLVSLGGPGISTSGRFARIPAAPRTAPLFGDDDLDWLALIEDNLPELETPDESGAPRIVLRMAEAEAGGVDDEARAEQLRSTMRALESGGAASIEALLGQPPAAAAAAPPGPLLAGGPSDTRQVKRFASLDKGDTTRPIGGGSKEETKGWEDDRPAPQETVRELDLGLDTKTNLRADDTRTHRVEGPGAERQASTSGAPLIEAFQARDLDPALVCARDATSADADRFRQLFHRVFDRGDPSPRVIVVTSPDAGAGKTTVAANLAIVAARLPGRGAVLVDADPRGRGVLPAFGLRRSEGLLEALGADVERDPRECVLQFQLGQLDVIPLGIPSSDAAELLVSSKMTRFVQRLREAYPDAAIIIDASSVLGTADPLALGRAADGVILVARAGHTGKDELRRAVDIVGRERLLGVVLNDAA